MGIFSRFRKRSYDDYEDEENEEYEVEGETVDVEANATHISISFLQIYGCLLLQD